MSSTFIYLSLLLFSDAFCGPVNPRVAGSPTLNALSSDKDLDSDPDMKPVNELNSNFPLIKHVKEKENDKTRLINIEQQLLKLINKVKKLVGKKVSDESNSDYTIYT